MSPHDFDPLPYPFDDGDLSLPTAQDQSLTQRSLNDLQHCLAAVTDFDGRILAVNRRWQDISTENAAADTASVGANYLRVCDQAARQGCADAAIVAQALRDVARGERLSFMHRYVVPCNGEDTAFLIQIAAYYELGERRLFVAHERVS